MTDSARPLPVTTGRNGAIGRGGAHGPLVELTLARIREFLREPEALFWTFLFPILISLALALAFPSSTGQAVLVGLEPGPASEALRGRLAGVAGITVVDIAAGGEERALREGSVHL